MRNWFDLFYLTAPLLLKKEIELIISTNKCYAMISLFPILKLCFSLNLIWVRASVRVSALFSSGPLNWHSTLDGEAPINGENSSAVRHWSSVFHATTWWDVWYVSPILCFISLWLQAESAAVVQIWYQLQRRSLIPQEKGRSYLLACQTRQGWLSDTACLGTCSCYILHT